MRSFLFASVVLIFSSCAMKPSGRILSKEERIKFQLNGIINNARICPTDFDEKNKSLVVTGGCEVVSCESVENEIICKAEKEKTQP